MSRAALLVMDVQAAIVQRFGERPGYLDRIAQAITAAPNRIGVSRCSLIQVEATRIHVLGLDAVDGTPVLDIKPYLREFGPRGEVRQPAWASELMREYY